MNLGEKIKKLRKQQNMSLRILASKIDISISFLSDIENGRSQPSLNRLKEIAQGLGCSASYLLGEQNEKQFLKDEKAIYEYDGINNLLKDKKFKEIINLLNDFERWDEKEKEELIEFIKKNKKI